jgi:GTP-binding protein HflX
MRGPGETQLETDRRLIGQRVKVLTRRLEKIGQQRETGRAQRAEIPVPSIALVGYTNAGKSTLFRAVTGADAYIADQLFATLDPTVRRITLPGGAAAVVADTVGFIRELPHELVAAFRSTLTEAREATLLLHVVDASDPRRDDHIAQVNGVLAEIGAGEIPQVLVYNKVDRLDFGPGVATSRMERDAEERPVAVWISAAKRLGLDLLLEAVTERIARVARRVRVRLPASAGALRSRLYAAGAVRTEIALEDGSLDLTVELPDAELLALARAPGVEMLAAASETPSAAMACAPGEAYLQSAPS